MMLKAFSPAKINLFLHVVGKRPDGHHALSTLMQTINLGDDLDFQLQDRDELTCTDPSIPIGSSNLVLKAANLYRRKTGVKAGLKVHLHKRIPIQAGLGGGSSNAATTLWAFNQLMGQVATQEQLQEWSAEIGSDIPFFFSCGTAHCQGRGEHVISLSPLHPYPCWIIKPPIGLATVDVYKTLRCTSYASMEVHHTPSYSLSSLSYVNDLEQPAFVLRPELKEIKCFLLKRGFKTVLLTGSGSAFFCLGEGSSEPWPSSFQTFAVHFLNRPSSRWYGDD